MMRAIGMLRHYVLDANHIPVAVDMMTWARWCEACPDERRVALTEIAPGLSVSTVFLGLDHNFFSAGAPALFETMVFSDYGGIDCWRYETWAQAQIGHNEAVRKIRARLSQTQKAPASPKADGERAATGGDDV